MSKIGSTRLFPEVEAHEEMVAAIPVRICATSAQEILSRFCEGRMLKFYSGRIEKTANSGFLKFGGKPLAELDTIVEYFMTAYSEEVHKIEEKIREEFAQLPQRQITLYNQLLAICNGLQFRPPTNVITEIFQACILEKSQFPITCDTLLKYLNQYGFTAPFQLTPADLHIDPNTEDFVPFVTGEFAFRQREFDELMNRLVENKNEILVKQLKSAKVKFDQSLASRSTMRIFETNVREMFERIALLNIESAP
jgi:hypothetical protein